MDRDGKVKSLPQSRWAYGEKQLRTMYSRLPQGKSSNDVDGEDALQFQAARSVKGLSLLIPESEASTPPC